MNEHVQAAFSMKFYKFFILQKKRNCKFFQQKDKCDNGYLNANGTTAADDDNCDDNGGDDDLMMITSILVLIVVVLIGLFLIWDMKMYHNWILVPAGAGGCVKPFTWSFGTQVSLSLSIILVFSLSTCVDKKAKKDNTQKRLNFFETQVSFNTNIARIANAVQVTICLLVSTSVY